MNLTGNYCRLCQEDERISGYKYSIRFPAASCARHPLKTQLQKPMTPTDKVTSELNTIYHTVSSAEGRGGV